MTKRSMDDEVSRLVVADMPLLFSAMVAIALYLAFSFTRFGPDGAVTSRTLLSLCSVVIISVEINH